MSASVPSTMPSGLSEREHDACTDILESGMAARQFIAGLTFEAFAAGLLTNDAVVRCIEIISEASRLLGPEFRARHPQIPWRDVADAGNLHRHSYHRVAPDIVWTTVHDPPMEILAVCRRELDLPPLP
jgi:uncharacterized protein with HEPN domain